MGRTTRPSGDCSAKASQYQLPAALATGASLATHAEHYVKKCGFYDLAFHVRAGALYQKNWFSNIFIFQDFSKILSVYENLINLLEFLKVLHSNIIRFGNNRKIKKSTILDLFAVSEFRGVWRLQVHLGSWQSCGVFRSIWCLKSYSSRNKICLKTTVFFDL